jgi:hypothetical protein
MWFKHIQNLQKRKWTTNDRAIPDKMLIFSSSFQPENATMKHMGIAQQIIPNRPEPCRKRLTRWRNGRTHVFPPNCTETKNLTTLPPMRYAAWKLL